MLSLKSIASGFSQIFFPHICAGCGSDLLNDDHLLCLHCYSELPQTNYVMHAGNPVERIFWGRMAVTAGTAGFYFSKGSVIQRLIHELKYNGKQEIGIFLGQELGKQIINSFRFMSVDALVPLPLFADKEFRRGYNQARIICDGMSEILKLPVITGNVIRKKFTETQTRKGRTSRWENVSDSFEIRDPVSLRDKHILLVDDVITTGATIEACGAKILEVPGTMISLATVAIANH